MTENVLYADEDIEVGYLAHSPDDNYVAFLAGGHDRDEYILQRGILREFAETSRDGLTQKLNQVNEMILMDARQRGLTQDSVHVAICQAYIENERRYKIVEAEMRSQQDSGNITILGGMERRSL